MDQEYAVLGAQGGAGVGENESDRFEDVRLTGIVAADGDIVTVRRDRRW